MKEKGKMVVSSTSTSMKIQKSVKVVHCPDIPMPKDLLKRKAFQGGRTPQHEENTENTSTREELRGFMQDIRQFNTSMEVGKSKRKIIEDKLTVLGAPPLKPQKMPLKLKIALSNARKFREKKELDRARESQVVNHQYDKIAKKSKMNKRERNYRKK